jgi:type VI secretion system secreted protein VgrG
VVIEAGTQLSLKVGGNFIDIGPAGVSIQGTMVMINSGGAAGSGCGSSPTSPKSPEKPDEADDGSKGNKMN